MSSMMDEMQKTLARRRAKVDRSSEEPEKSPGPAAKNGGPDNQEKGGSPGVAKDNQEKGASPGVVKGGQEKGASPGAGRGSDSSYPSSELEAMKQEILKEMRKEMNKAKQEIIDVIRQELSKK